MTSENDPVHAAAEALCALKQYEFRGPLGSGAFKKAFLVNGSPGAFALKVAEDTANLDRALREVEALRGCDHPSIARNLGAYLHEHLGAKFWVVEEEFLAGGTLEQRLTQHPLSTDQVRQLGLSLGDVLAHLHERRLVHRDIKPANIMYRDTGDTPVLTDFGVVRMLDRPTLTMDFMGIGPGTPAYAAPEQLNNQKELIDWRTDQFGLAVVLSEALLKRHPYAAPQESRGHGIRAAAMRSSLPQATVEQLTALGFPALVRALSPWPISRYRRPADFIRELSNNKQGTT